MSDLAAYLGAAVLVAVAAWSCGHTTIRRWRPGWQRPDLRRGRRFADPGETTARAAAADTDTGPGLGAGTSTSSGTTTVREATIRDVGLIATDLDSDAQWLAQVARAFRRSPVIPELLERLRAEEG